MEVVIENVIEDGIEGPAFFRIRQHHNSEIFFRHQHHSRDEASHATGVPDQLATVIIAQSPAQRVIREVRLQAGQRRWRIADGKNRLRRPHFPAIAAR